MVPWGVSGFHTYACDDILKRKGLGPQIMLSKFENVFIVTYGRSGSTLLSGVLNSIPGFIVRGENHNYMYSLYSAYRKVVASVENHGGQSASASTDPWWGVNEIDLDVFVADIRRLADNVLIGGTKEKPLVYGFKEIRYPWVTKNGDLEGYLSFLRKLYPRSCFIFNYRNLDEVFRSGWWPGRDAGEKEEGRRLIAEFESAAGSIASQHGDYCFEITYRDICSMSPRVEEMFNFLGVPFIQEDVTRVLSKRHSYDNRPEGDGWDEAVPFSMLKRILGWFHKG